LHAQENAQKVIAGDIRAAARLMRDLDDRMPGAIETLKLLYPHTGRAQILGITGSPGVGKSTLTDVLVGRLRAAGRKVGVVAVDPTSPFTGGAILGDRIRMQRHATDEGVFIRSLATRGQFGGLTASTRGVVAVMDAMGKDVILVETVGVGQDEVDIVSMADTTIIVTVPGLGDDIQALKAGILEAGDIFVVNKMDREDAQRTANQLQAMLAMEREGARAEGWAPPVLLTCARDGRGLDELLAAMDDHRTLLTADNNRLLLKRRKQRAFKELLDLIQNRTVTLLLERLGSHRDLEALAEEIASGQKDPYTVCDQIMAAAHLG